MLVNLRSPARAQSSRDSLGHLELLVLLAVLRSGDEAFGKPIAGTITAAGFPVHISAVYTTLSRLEKKAMVQSRTGGKIPKRGGRAKRYFTVSTYGKQMVQRSLRVIRFLVTDERGLKSDDA